MSMKNDFNRAANPPPPPTKSAEIHIPRPTPTRSPGPKIQPTPGPGGPAPATTPAKPPPAPPKELQSAPQDAKKAAGTVKTAQDDAARAQARLKLLNSFNSAAKPPPSNAPTRKR